MKKNTFIQANKRSFFAVLALLFAAQLLLPIIIPKASAATLSKTMVRLDRLAKSTATTGTVCAAASAGGAGTEGKVLLTFPAGFTVGASGTWTTNTTNKAWPSGAAAWPSIQATGTSAGQVATFTSGDLPDAATYCFNWTLTTAISTPSTTGSYSIQVDTQTGASAAIDTGTAATSIVDTNCGSGSTPCDQVVVSASINQTFSFSISANTDALGTLTTGSPSTSPTPRVITVSTNAKNGWQVWGQDSNQGLTSTAASKTIASNCSAGAGSNTTLTAGNEGYNTGVATSAGTGTGSLTINAVFDRAATNYKGGGLCSTNLQNIVSSNGPNSGATVTVYNSASINGATAAATDYTDTQTYVGAGMF